MFTIENPFKMNVNEDLNSHIDRQNFEYAFKKVSLHKLVYKSQLVYTN